MYIVSWIQNKIRSYSRSIVNQTQHSSVIIITINAYIEKINKYLLSSIFQIKCATFCVVIRRWIYNINSSIYHHTKLWEFYFSHRKYAFHIPTRTIPIPINSPKLLPFRGEFSFLCTPLDFTRTWLRYARVFAIANPSVVCLSVVCLSTVTFVRPSQGLKLSSNRASIWRKFQPLSRVHRAMVD